MTDMIWKARPNTRVPAAEPGEVTYVLSVNNNDAGYMTMPEEAWQDFATRLGLVEVEHGIWRMEKAAAEIIRLRAIETAAREVFGDGGAIRPYAVEALEKLLGN